MSDQFNPLLMRLGRESRGMTQKDLARASGLSQGQVSKLEIGQREPTGETVDRLSSALRYPPSFFYESLDYRNVPPGLFRKRKTIRAGVLKRVNAIINIRRLHVRKLLEAVSVKPEVPLVDLEEAGRRPDEVAQEIRCAWHVPPGPLPNVIELLEDHGVLVIPVPFGTAKFDAVSYYDRRDGLPPLIVVDSEVTGDRLRFTLLHEFAHIVMHHHLPLPPETAEAEADSFAGEFAMPTEDLRPQVLGRLDMRRFVGLKARWRMSVAALIMRVQEIRRLTPSQKTRLWQMYAPYRLNEPMPIAREEPSLLREIVDYHLRILGYSPDALAAALSLTEAEFSQAYMGGAPPLRLVSAD